MSLSVCCFTYSEFKVNIYLWAFWQGQFGLHSWALPCFPSPKHDTCEQREGETNRAQIGEWREVEHRCNRCYSMGQGHVDRTTD